MTKYEVIITPTYKTDGDVKFTVILDNSKFVIDTTQATGVTVNGSAYTVTVPANTTSGYHTKIYLYDNPDDEVTPTLEEAIISNESTIDPTIIESTESTKYTYKTKVVVKGFTINYYVDNTLYVTENHAFGVTLKTPDEPAEREGYKFSGWNDVPVTMPAKNVDIYSTFDIQSYNLIYKVDGVQYKKYTLEYGTKITTEAIPVRQGYTFSGWSEIPETMPASDVLVEGSFTVNQYTMNLSVDGVVVFTATGDYGSEIDYSDLVTPSKTGYKFDGWSSELPVTIPAKNLDIEAKFTQLSYSITYKDGDTVLKTVSGLHYGDAISTYDVPSKVGYTSNGWDVEIPSTMPDHNIVANAQYNINSHNVYYYVDYGKGAGVELAKEFDNITYESEVPTYAYADIEGYTKGSVVDADGKAYVIPSIMPDEDIKAYVTYTINEYTLSYTIDGVTTTKKYKYGEAIEVPELPTKTGYDVAWSEEFPTTMGAKDVNIVAVYTIHTWTLTYELEGEIVSAITVEYDSYIDYTSPTKEGYTFDGWTDILGVQSVKMPDEDYTLYGSFTVNKHTITYVVDGKVYKTVENVEYGSAVVLEDDPTKEGYTFTGWTGYVPTMPDKDITITGAFTINKHDIVYTVDGAFYKRYKDVEYGKEIILDASPEKEGYTFSGWNNTYTTMPDNDITITGTFTINSYVLTYYLDNVVYSSETYDYGSSITPLGYTAETGYSFSGWQNVPSTMPAKNVNVSGTTTHIQYTLTYVIEGTTAGTQTYFYNDTITALTAETREGYTFEWKDIPEKMPNSNLTVEGVYTEIVETNNLYYGSVYNNVIDTLADTDFSDKLDVIEDVEKATEYSFTLYGEVSEINADDLSDDEYDEWESTHHYSQIIIIPSTMSIDTLTENGVSYVSKFGTYKTITLDGVNYTVYRFTNDSLIAPSNMTKDKFPTTIKLK